jgi:molecular chaperone GrpE
MPESAPPPPPGNPPESHRGPLTPESIERLLDDFRSWLGEVAALADRPDADAPLTPAPPDPPDLHTLLGQMIAVRQELNLQTRAVRSQQEQSAEALDLLSNAVAELEKAPRPAAPAPPADDLLRPLLKTLIDVRDALALALREAERVGESLLPLLETIGHVPDPPAVSLTGVNAPALSDAGRPLLARLLGVRGIDPRAVDDWKERTRAAYEQGAADALAGCVTALREYVAQGNQSAGRITQLLASLVAGYRMGLQRIDRALEQHGLEAIPTEGAAFDPERMEVLEAVADSGLPAGAVVAEVRRGYLWRGRVFRYSQVRVARP